MQMLNLIAFVLAPVHVAPVQFHLVVKLVRLPYLQRSAAWRGALQQCNSPGQFAGSLCS